MRGTTRASGKRSRAPDAFRRTIADIASDMEEPLYLAHDLALALELMGYGMENNGGEGGRAVLALSVALLHRLDAVQEIWGATMDAASVSTPSASTQRVFSAKRSRVRRIK